jgi:hypothetical protein
MDAAPLEAAVRGTPEAQMVNLLEELVLLTIDDDGSVAFTAGGSGFRMSAIGACLVELNLAGRVDADLEAVRVLSAESTGNAAQDLVLAEVVRGPERPVQAWVRDLVPLSGDVVQAALRSLASRGILQPQEARFLWVLKSRRYTVIDGTEQKEAKLRILHTLLGDDLPTPHDSTLLGLARVGGLLEGFLSVAEIARLDERIDKVGGLDLITKGVETALREEQEQIARSFLAPIC